MLGQFSGEVHLDQDFDLAILLRNLLVNLSQQVYRINRVNHVEQRGGLPGLVRLEMPDEVPAKGKAARRKDLGLGLLDLVLAEVDLPRPGGSANGFEGKRLGNSDEANRGGKAGRRDGRRPRCDRGRRSVVELFQAG
jgi:hypothetical protein